VHLRANDPQRGAASVEHIGLAMLVATALLAGVAAFAAGPPVEEGRELGTAITRKLRCAPRLPGPCWRDPLTDAYGRPLAGLVRALAPAPEPRARAGGVPLVGVDFRSCRSAGCAAWTGDERLTASNRRTTAFTSVEDRRRTGGGVEVSYWIYRPSLGWERVVRRAGAADVAPAAKTPLLESASPKLVPLETLPGRNHYDFPRPEEPPWRWQVESVYPG
jgi:Flp pilus assembly pilin Flp